MELFLLTMGICVVDGNRLYLTYICDVVCDIFSYRGTEVHFVSRFASDLLVPSAKHLQLSVQHHRPTRTEQKSLHYSTVTGGE